MKNDFQANEMLNHNSNYLNKLIEGTLHMNELFISILRTAISYILLLAVTYLFGKKMTTHLNYHSFAVSITIGSIIANMGFETELKFLPMLASFLTLAFIFALTSYLSFKKVNLRKFLAGQPIVIIEKGMINTQQMSRLKYTMDDLQQQLREQGTFHIDEIETAILEVSGKLSIHPKEQFKPVVKHDLDQLFIYRAVEFIIDGKIIEDNLTSVQNRDWIEKHCQARNVKIDQVTYAVLGTNGNFYLIK